MVVLEGNTARYLIRHSVPSRFRANSFGPINPRTEMRFCLSAGSRPLRFCSSVFQQCSIVRLRAPLSRKWRGFSVRLVLSGASHTQGFFPPTYPNCSLWHGIECTRVKRPSKFIQVNQIQNPRKCTDAHPLCNMFAKCLLGARFLSTPR